ncbi:hypothetical protein G4L39_13770 [Limisphaera ngatamarikiensis]|uniref:Rhamnogalacturonan I lyase beta-sheet domain-containing protein n=1 Tax=Limisphaera ngatamarikiensis TaxID=1324935 RepID=A0A6M1RY76_9BACT|nr:hypothetical protein [Limisphaera ngatamarikiensis]NGO40451.1 hypothetical protein [Limisphaera ngatamarikiensis]
MVPIAIAGRFAQPGRPVRGMFLHGGTFLAALLAVVMALPARAQRQMEPLGRGLVALRISSTQVYVSWRLLGNDPEDLGFNLYRAAGGAPPVRLNAAPLTNTTDYVDTPPNLATVAYT